MRPSRLVIVGLAGLCALHVFMLAGHGGGHHPSAAMTGVAAHAGAMTAPVLSPPMDGDEGGGPTGMDMTVACLAVVAGLLFLWLRQPHRPATRRPERQTVTRYPARARPAGARTRSLEELCISLT
jgi:hypothetical protein